MFADHIRDEKVELRISDVLSIRRAICCLIAVVNHQSKIINLMDLQGKLGIKPTFVGDHIIEDFSSDPV